MLQRVLMLVFCLAICLLIVTAFRGIFFPDEGYILNTASRILDGQQLYKDFDFVYPPLSAYLTALSFVALGKSILAERILTLLISLVTSYVLFRFAKQYSKSQLVSFIPMATYIAWGPTHINFMWPGMLAVNGGIIATLLLIEGCKNKHSRLLFLSGVIFALVMLTKQNYAVAVLFELCSAYWLFPILRKKQYMLIVLCGLLSPLLLTLFYLALTNSLPAFITNFYVNIIQMIVLKGSISTSLPLGNTFFSSAVKLVFYFSPFLLSLWSIASHWKKRKDFVWLSLFVLLFFLAGFRPVTDYVHLVPLLAIQGIPLFLLWQAKRTRLQTLLLTLISCTIILLGVWSALFFGYYRWQPPLIKNTVFIENPRVLIWADPETQLRMQVITHLLKHSTKPDEEVYLNYYAPMVYFLTDRQNPTRYDYLGLPIAYQSDLITTLEKKKVKTIVTFFLNKQDQSIIGDYIMKRYRKTHITGEYEIWVRK